MSNRALTYLLAGGGRHSPSHDAYMLVYVSEDARADEPDASLLPSEVRAAFEAELAGRI